ncbi:MAG: DUF697 domain-containing protein [Chloroflexi bacterium]|nr:DUF697 domain-containing protein [Chloroflexota bacterium]
MGELIQQNEVTTNGKSGLTAKLLDRLAQVIDETDETAALAQVSKLKANNPDAPPEELVNHLVMQKCRDTAVVGGTTSGAMLIPGLGTISALTVGIAADLSLTFKMQAELVLEIAAVYNHHLTPEEKRRVVLLVTGLSAGTTAVAHRTGNRLAKRATTRIASKYVAKAIPFIGIAASATTNAVMTYFIGQRAQAYFSLGPEAMQDWSATLPAMTGVDRRKLVAGIKAGGNGMKNMGGTAVAGAKKAGRSLNHLRRSRAKNKVDPNKEDIIIPII